MLITTKLHIPPMKSRMIMRRHLTDRLREGSSSRLVVICGLPGSGKTSLACQWIAEDHLPVAWYSLDKTDNDADLFFRYLLTSLGTIDDTIASQVAPLLQELRQFSGPEIIPLIIRLFVDLPRDIYLVLDDYHLIHTKEIHDALSYFLEYMPPRMHMVILSRHAIPLSLSRFRVRSQLTEIVASDLKFTEEETERFFTDIMPVTLTTDEVHELARYTEGWVGGLQLFGLSLKGKGLNDLGDILSRACQETTDYLIDEVIKVQPRKVKTFIQTTALLDRFNVDLCREVTGFTDTPDILEHLYRNNLFLIPLNTENTWHRYHHLLSEAVRKGVKNINPALYRDIQRKAALWFARHGYLEDAFRHAFASEDQQFAADLLEDYILPLLENYEHASSLRWLAKVPSEILTNRTLLKLHECGLKLDSLQLTTIETTVQEIDDHQSEAFERYQGDKRTLCLDLLAYLKYILPYFREPVETDQTRLNETLKMISHENRFFSGYIKVAVSLSHFLRGNPPLASETLKEASGIIFSSKSIWARMFWYKNMADVERVQGHLYRSEAILGEAFRSFDEKGLFHTPLKLLLYLPMAWIWYLRNDLEKALVYAERGLEYAHHSQFTRDYMEGNYLLGLLWSALNRPDEVERCIDRMRAVAKIVDAPNTGVAPESWIARLSMTQNDLTGAEAWAQQRHISSNEPFSYRFVHECLGYADLLCRQHRHEEMIDILEPLRKRSAERNMMEAVLETDLFLAGAYYASGEQMRARKIMDQALASTEAEGIIRPFINHCPSISPILADIRHARLRGRISSHLAIILDVSATVTRMAAEKEQEGMENRLSPRETEILQLLAAGYRYREIADKAFVSLNTVRSHIRNIFKKLNVRTTDQAIRRANDLGLCQTELQ